MALDVDQIREQFPSLSVEDDFLPRIYFDNPGGTQVSRRVIDRMVRYLESDNANSGAPFRTSEETDQLLAGSHEAVAAFLNAESGREIVFGQNMTTLTFAMSRTLGRTMRSGDEIVVTRMDHDGNISPWLFLAEDLHLTIRWLDFSPETYRYDLSELDGLLNERTRLVAVNHASNAIGTINDVRSVARRAHAAGALVYVDAVQYAPHAAINVRSLECDFLVCSSYKFFGPHQGILWGREALLERLVPYKVRPCDDRLPVRFETGTLSHESIAGVLGAIEYLEWLGETMGEANENGPSFEEPAAKSGDPSSFSRRGRTLRSAMNAIRSYERGLCNTLLEGLGGIEGLRIHGLTRSEDLDDRVPTVSFTMDGRTPREINRHLAGHNIFAWDGDYYALEVIRRLGLEPTGGMLRIGLAHYNTEEEIGRLVDALKEL